MRRKVSISILLVITSVWTVHACQINCTRATISSVAPLYYSRDADRLVRILRPDAKECVIRQPGSPAPDPKESTKPPSELDTYFGSTKRLPLFGAPAKAGAPSAIERVSISAFPESASVFLIGCELDVREVENLIAGFDRPTPQAKMALWTLKVSVRQDASHIENLNRAVIEVEQSLARARMYTIAAGTLFRECLAEKVKGVQEMNTQRYIDLPQNDRLAAFQFFEPELLKHLGMKPKLDEARASFLLRNLPDPLRATTLGEAMLIFMMGKYEYQREILNSWSTKLQDYLSKDPAFAKHLSKADAEKLAKRQLELFPVTKRVFGHDTWAPSLKGLTPAQSEMLSALQRAIVENIIFEMRAMEKDKKTAHEPELCVRYNFLQDEILLNKEVLRSALRGTTANFYELVAQYPQSLVNARVAAADDLLKKHVQAVEEDVDALVILPTVQRIERILRNRKINVGHFQRSTMLTSNRNDSRMGVVTAAQVNVGETTDIRELIDFARTISGLPELPTGADGKPKLPPWRVLLGEPIKNTESVFKVAGGDVFVLTPILDPSGQALRYDFQYTSRSPITKVSGPDELPEITDYRLTTEVQLSTFELRTIASFAQTTETRIPEKRTGGIPVLNQVPLLRDLPLIGWFSKRSGRSGVSQHSFVLGQTTIYPTIGDLLHLLSPPASSVRIGGR